MSSPIVPAIGRLVLLTVIAASGLPVEIPAIITNVHSDTCVSVVGLSAIGVEGLHAGGTVPMTSVSYDEDASKRHTWRWMAYQKGQAAKVDTISADLMKRVEAIEAAIKSAIDADAAARAAAANDQA